MILNVNYDDSQEMEFETLPQGEYNCILTGVKEGTSKAGNATVNWEYTVIDGEFKNRKLWSMNTVDGKDNNFYLVKTLKSLDPKVKLNGPVNFEKFVGTEVKAVVGHRTYNGRTYEDIKKISLSKAAPVVPDSYPGSDECPF